MRKRKKKSQLVSIVQEKDIFSYCSADQKHVRNVKGQERSINLTAFPLIDFISISKLN